ncbi:MAG: S-layer protein [Methanomicrobiales archaeon]|nr:S-layer protein [Methanomicrobiales archaeon]
MSILFRIWPLFMFILLVAILPPSVDAGTMYLSGGPELSASIAGTNEYEPGASTSIGIMVENHGLIDMKMVRSDLVARDDLPNTAKLLKVNLGNGNAPLTVKSDSQVVGDLLGGASRTVSFDVKIASDAAAGTYDLPLDLEYTYLYAAESEGQDNIRYYYKTEQKTLNLRVNIKSTARLQIMNVETEHLNVGTEGYLTVTLRNSGNEDVKQGVLRITRNGNSPIIPTDSSVFRESISQNGEVSARFKVSVSTNAEGDQVYPVDITLRYENAEGDTVDTETVTFGVPVGGKVDISIVSSSAVIAPGETKVIEVVYRNIGSTTVYSAQARISAVDPFTSGDDTAFLGDIAPGDTCVARFEITADSTATVKEYGLDSEIRYRDAMENSLISDTMKVKAQIVEKPGMLASVLHPLSLSLIAVGFIGSVWVLRGLHRKQ